MVLENPMYIDASARHTARQVRLLDFVAVEGQEGVLQFDHLAIRALSVPNDQIDMMPGAYSILAKHLGGSFEAYLGKVSIAERSVGITPTNASGPRTDLVILRVENPFVVGSGNWLIPGDPLEGPYLRLFVVEGVPANINHITAFNNTWSAITLARITRPASTGIVTQAHITDLRSLAKLGGQRIIIIDNPPATVPPIAQIYWTESTPCQSSAVVPAGQPTFINFPLAADWQVPVPIWATGFDILCTLNPQVTNHVWGEMRLVINNGAITNDACGIVPSEYDFNYKGGPGPERITHLVGGTGFLQKDHRGKIVNMRLQARSKSADVGFVPGVLAQERGTRVNIMINFKRDPSFDP